MTDSANVELVRSIYADWERSDYSRVDWAHPEIEWVVADGLSPGAWTGLAEMVEANRDFFSAWEEWRGEAEEYRELDGDRVLVLVRYSGRGKASGLDLGQIPGRGASVFHVRDGNVTRLVNYLDRDIGLADLGLGPEGDAT